MNLFRKLSCFILFISIFCFLSDPRTTVFAEDAEEDILSHVFFFGDSTTAHLACRGGIPDDHVWSGAGNTVLFETVNRTKCVHLEEENVDLTLADAVSLKKPEILVITLGVSGGAGFLPKEAFVSVYREMLESVQNACPSTKIVVQSILPLSDKSPAEEIARYFQCSKKSFKKAIGALYKARRIVIDEREIRKA